MQALNALHCDDDSIQTEGTGSHHVDYVAQASQWLSLALNYDNTLADAWCELGVCCWSQGRSSEAVGHFRQALHHSVSRVR